MNLVTLNLIQGPSRMLDPVQHDDWQTRMSHYTTPGKQRRKQQPDVTA